MKTLKFYQYGFFASLFLFLTTLTLLLSYGIRNNWKLCAAQESIGGRGFAHFRNGLGFDALQLQSYDSLLSAYQEQASKLRQQMASEQQQIFSQLSEGATDTLALKQASENAAQLQHKIRMLTFNHLRQIAALSNTSQRQALNQLYKELLRENTEAQNKGYGKHRLRHGQRNQ